jgi:hypothetical protein
VLPDHFANVYRFMDETALADYSDHPGDHHPGVKKNMVE